MTPIKGFLEHVDLLLVKQGEKVTVEIYVHTEGELAPGGNLLEHVLNALPVEAEATHIPESVTVSIAGLEAGATILAKDITLPAGTTLAVEEDTVVLQVLAAQAEEAADEAEGEGEAAPRPEPHRVTIVELAGSLRQPPLRAAAAGRRLGSMKET